MGLLDMLSTIEENPHIDVGHIISEKEVKGCTYKVYTRVSIDIYYATSGSLFEVFRMEDCYDVEDVLDDADVRLMQRSEIVELFEDEEILFMIA